MMRVLGFLGFVIVLWVVMNLLIFNCFLSLFLIKRTQMKSLMRLGMLRTQVFLLNL